MDATLPRVVPETSLQPAVTNISTAISEHVGFAASSFAPEELAYLVLTTKVELPLRDRLAWSLHTTGNWVVAREWKNMDLALLKKDDLQPVAIVQAKLMGLFDAALITPNFDFRKFIPEDIAKARARANPDTELYELVFAQHLDKPAGKLWDPVIKYRAGYERRLKVYGTPQAVHDEGLRILRSVLPQLAPTRSGLKPAGTCYGISVVLYWWLVGPFVGAST